MKSYKTIINVKNYDEIIFKANEVYEGDLDDRILTMCEEGDFEYNFSQKRTNR